jgi:hypothetical protein
MRKQLISVLALATAGFFHAGAQATVIASNTTAITSTAQKFSMTYNLDGTKYTGVTVSITAKGDYGHYYYSAGDEYFNFFIDGYQAARWTAFSGSGVSTTENVKDYDYTLTGTLSLTDTQWASVSADKLMTISWQNGADVDAYNSIGGADYVSFSVMGSIMPATTPVAANPVAGNPVVTAPVTVVSGSAGAMAAKAVPEPASLALLGLGLAGLGFARRRNA